MNWRMIWEICCLFSWLGLQLYCVGLIWFGDLAPGWVLFTLLLQFATLYVDRKTRPQPTESEE
jgi:hypothetical protein